MMGEDRFQVPSLFRSLRQASTPRILMLYAEDDPYVEKECSEEVASLLGIQPDSAAIVRRPEDLEEASAFVQHWWAGGDSPKNAAVIFKDGFGGHYLQKHQASFIASCVKIMAKL